MFTFSALFKFVDTIVLTLYVRMMQRRQPIGEKKNPEKTFNSLSIYELEYSSSVTNYAEKSNKRSTVLLLRLVRFPA